jgi:hypothetical protein
MFPKVFVVALFALLVAFVQANPHPVPTPTVPHLERRLEPRQSTSSSWLHDLQYIDISISSKLTALFLWSPAEVRIVFLHSFDCLLKHLFHTAHSVFTQVTSAGGSVISDVTSMAPGVFETVTCKLHHICPAAVYLTFYLSDFSDWRQSNHCYH